MSEFISKLFFFSAALVLIIFFARMAWDDFNGINDADESDNDFDELSKQMLSDPVFSSWADNFGLSYCESAAAWEAYKLGRSINQNTP